MNPFLQAFFPCHPDEVSDQVPGDSRDGDNENQSDIDGLSPKQIYGNMIEILHSEQYANCGQGNGCECFKHLIISLFYNYGLSGVFTPSPPDRFLSWGERLPDRQVKACGVVQ